MVNFSGEIENSTFDEDLDYMGVADTPGDEAEMLGYDELTVEEINQYYPELMGRRSFRSWLKKRRKRGKSRRKAKIKKIVRNWKKFPKWKKALLIATMGPLLIGALPAAAGAAAAVLPRIGKKAAVIAIIRRRRKRKARESAEIKARESLIDSNTSSSGIGRRLIARLRARQKNYSPAPLPSPQQYSQQIIQPQKVRPAVSTVASLPVQQQAAVLPVQEKKKTDIMKMLPIVGLGAGALFFMMSKKRK